MIKTWNNIYLEMTNFFLLIHQVNGQIRLVYNCQLRIGTSKSVLLTHPSHYPIQYTYSAAALGKSGPGNITDRLTPTATGEGLLLASSSSFSSPSPTLKPSTISGFYDLRKQQGRLPSCSVGCSSTIYWTVCTRGASNFQEWYHRVTRLTFHKLKHMDQSEDKSGSYSLVGDEENNQLSLFDKPLPCCGCGIGWFSLLLGCIFPLMWYYSTILYFGNYYQKDPRERTGLAACAIAALIFTVAVLIVVAIIVF